MIAHRGALLPCKIPTTKPNKPFIILLLSILTARCANTLKTLLFPYRSFTLKKHLPQAKVFGIDISEKALEVAKSNALKNNVEVEFLNLDILKQPIPHNSTFNIIVSNPPYVLNSEAQQMDARVLEHEPHLALFVEDNDPIIFYKRIINLCDKHLEQNGWLFFELNPMYAMDVKSYANDSKIFNFTEILNDMSGKQRFLKAQKR